MRVRQYVDFSQEVDVDVGWEDILAALVEDGSQTEARAQRALNKVAEVLKAISPAIIADLGTPARALICAFLTKEAARYQEQGALLE